MKIINFSNHVVGQNVGRDVNGDEEWQVFVKAVYSIGDGGQLNPVDETPDFITEDTVTGSGAASSLRVASETCPPKSKIDYAMFFSSDGKAIHQSNAVAMTSILKTWGANYFGSHGCVRLSESDAAKLFVWAPSNTPVMIDLSREALG